MDIIACLVTAAVVGMIGGCVSYKIRHSER